MSVHKDVALGLGLSAVRCPRVITRPADPRARGQCHLVVSAFFFPPFARRVSELGVLNRALIARWRTVARICGDREVRYPQKCASPAGRIGAALNKPAGP
ncbi:hypothetical protein MDV078.5 [Gallid alphaherpesvirus 2]|uniref:Uncharacterized protein n=1 Tax=Gallid alphaherpesvirus 2 TaxID=10390 RepID=Q19B54_9ALPH|nr:hypothetical protein MDV002.6 [Gallid alphaherpesvirus 2]ACR02730.1 hypothetical protein MDV078.5 [synthetic construct]ABF72333.1 hypothetical protein MDV078.5 [Gallid alphaherpesvirus 2]ABG22644.1 hypothetical protein MDV078.5 [Gallid alphaherpesvirus 2]ABG22675.1 hypothetical protein MDV078.5 [Gallid alphaherpesvirus 2]